MIAKGVKGYFLTGLLVLVPLYISVYIVALIVGFMDGFLAVLPKSIHPDTLLGFHLPGLGFIATIIIVFLVGIFATNFLGHKIVELGEKLLSKVPVLRMVYNASKQFLETFFAQGSTGFRKVALVEFPRAGVWSIGFITGKPEDELLEKTASTAVNVFIPLTPNPTSGFYIIVKEAELVYIDMSVEDAFKLIMTGGMVAPKKHGTHGADVIGNDTRH